MNYIDILNKRALIAHVPLKIGNREMPDSLKAKVFLMRVQYNSIIDKFEKEMQDVLKEIKKDYPEFDTQAADIEKMKSIDERLKAFNEHKGEDDKKPAKPSEEEIQEADKIREGEKEFNELNEKLTRQYIEAREEKIKEEVSIKERKFTIEEFSQVIGVIGSSPIEIEKKEIPAEMFLSDIASLFVE